MRETWSRHHPDWQMRLWREADLGWLRNQTLFERATSYEQKADIARYEIIGRYGGVYLDTDMECLRPIDGLLVGLGFFSGRESAQAIAIGIMGATPGHPLLRELVASLPPSCLTQRRINYQTGPWLLTRVVERHRWEERSGVRIFPPAFFYPYHWSEPERQDEPFPMAFAVHHWGTPSWQRSAGVRAALSDLHVSSVFDARLILSELSAGGRGWFARWARRRAGQVRESIKRRSRRRLDARDP
jgi:mannosyltransferase OCH1-like enzyme